MFNRRKTVDQIVGTFTTAITELTEEAERLREESADAAAEAARQEVLSDERANESFRATAIAERLRDLLG